MKKALLILALAVFLITTPALAKQNEAKNNSKKADIEVEQVCDPSNFWKNHGAYVSCVAKLHQGGVVVSTAAKAEIGKKSEATPVPTISPSPSASPSSSPSASPTPTASPSPSASATPAGAILDALNASRVDLEVAALIEVLKNIILSLQNLMTD